MVEITDKIPGNIQGTRGSLKNKTFLVSFCHAKNKSSANAIILTVYSSLFMNVSIGFNQVYLSTVHSKITYYSCVKVPHIVIMMSENLIHEWST